MDQKSQIPNIETLLGRALALKVHHFERARLRVSKMKSDLTFLKRCRDSSSVPSFAKIKHPLNNSRNERVFLLASLGIIRSEISRVRKYLDLISRKLLSSHLELSYLIPADIWTIVDARST